MIVAALLDAGAALDPLRSQLATLPLDGVAVSAEKVRKQGFAATAFTVHCAASRPHRHLQQVTDIIRGGTLSATVVRQACAIFERLGGAEAGVHGVPLEQVHFHEVGALDAIADVVGACVALESLGVDQVRCSAIPVGSGTVACAHGTLPVPAPATAALLREVPLADSGETGELITPTGAAILTTLASSFGPLGGMAVQRIGYGAGRRDGQRVPNLLRVLIGEPTAGAATDTVTVLETNIDDQSPELVGHALGKLLSAGALDAYCQPIYMKKGRPGLLLTVLCNPDAAAAMEALIYTETTTFGIRSRTCRRSRLERTCEVVDLDGTPVTVKIGRQGGRIVTVAPEYEDCRRVAEQRGAALKAVMHLVVARWQQQDRSGAQG